MTPTLSDKLAELKRLAGAIGDAADSDWCIEACGEKGDGSNVVGVAYGPHDEDAQSPLSGWLKSFDNEGNEINYYRDEVVCVIDHSERAANQKAAYIAAVCPKKLMALLEEIEREMGK